MGDHLRLMDGGRQHRRERQIQGEIDAAIDERHGGRRRPPIETACPLCDAPNAAPTKKPPVGAAFDVASK